MFLKLDFNKEDICDSLFIAIILYTYSVFLTLDGTIFLVYKESKVAPREENSAANDQKWLLQSKCLPPLSKPCYDIA